MIPYSLPGNVGVAWISDDATLGFVTEGANTAILTAAGKVIVSGSPDEHAKKLTERQGRRRNAEIQTQALRDRSSLR